MIFLQDNQIMSLLCFHPSDARPLFWLAHSPLRAGSCPLTTRMALCSTNTKPLAALERASPHLPHLLSLHVSPPVCRGVSPSL